MVSVTVLGLVVAAFIAGTLVASPEFRAFAAATIGSADIIDNSVQSVDIKDAQIKTADLAGNAVTSGKIKDGEIKGADISQAFMKKVTLQDDAAGNALGWVPQTGGKMTITDAGVTTASTILVNLIFTEGVNEFGKQCFIGDVNSGNFQLICNFSGGTPPIDLRYIVIN
jgi:hypothetical protein